MLSSITCSLLFAKINLPIFLNHFLILAQEDEERGYNVSWFLVLLCVILALLVTLTPTKREEKVERVKE